MIALLGASAIALAALQASIAAPTSTFRGCLHNAADKATSEKVSADAIDAYLRKACTAEMGSLKQALVAFRLKNGMSRKAAADDAQMTIDDYVSTPVENFKFTANMNAPKAEPPRATPVPTPASAPASPAAANSQSPNP